MTPILLIPGLLCTAEVFAPQVATLWPYGPVTIASTLEGNTIAEMATTILAGAPRHFALAGISMGGYISLEIMRQAPERVTRLALLNTQARAPRHARSHCPAPRHAGLRAHQRLRLHAGPSHGGHRASQTPGRR